MIDPKELKYTKDDEWVRFEGEEAFVGITDYAQSELGDLVFVNLPEVDDEVVAGEPFGDVESVKAVADVFSFAGDILFRIAADLGSPADHVHIIILDAQGFRESLCH